MQPTPEAASIAVERTATPQAPEVRTITRFSREVYLKFEKSLPQAVIDRSAQDAGCDASFKLGVQYVLQRLRSDLVVD